MTLPPVQTTLGALDPVEARNLLDMLAHDGIIPLRRLMKNRNLVATRAICHPETSAERLRYEAGALDFILELDGILDGGLQRAYASAVGLTRQSIAEPAHDASDARRHGPDEREGDDSGPE